MEFEILKFDARKYVIKIKQQWFKFLAYIIDSCWLISLVFYILLVYVKWDYQFLLAVEH